MTDDPVDHSVQGVLPLRLRTDHALKQVRQLAAYSSNIDWSVHTLQRMHERDITDSMVVQVLREGDVQGDVIAGKHPGEWKVKIVKAIRGRREIGVVALIMRRSRLFIKTVEWEDMGRYSRW